MLVIGFVKVLMIGAITQFLPLMMTLVRTRELNQMKLYQSACCTHGMIQIMELHLLTAKALDILEANFH